MQGLGVLERLNRSQAAAVAATYDDRSDGGGGIEEEEDEEEESMEDFSLSSADPDSQAPSFSSGSNGRDSTLLEVDTINIRDARRSVAAGNPIATAVATTSAVVSGNVSAVSVRSSVSSMRLVEVDCNNVVGNSGDGSSADMSALHLPRRRGSDSTSSPLPRQDPYRRHYDNSDNVDDDADYYDDDEEEETPDDDCEEV